ncbi:MAG: hypothetical protein M3N29_10705 [Chloroflexota bacterium]|nr:hypothetical protein [Chloroflexota bacterium]
MTDELEPGSEQTPPAPAEPDPGTFIGHDAELTRDEFPSTGEAMQDENPDPGWSRPPEGHREQSKTTDDDLRREG